MFYCKNKPFCFVKTKRENIKFFINNDNNKTDIPNSISYNCFILTKDKKMLLCIRKY